MSHLLKARIQERLDYKGLNPFEAARMAGQERSFINDLLIGKKQTIRGKAIPALAQMLGCDPEYLLGSQVTPRRGAMPSEQGVTLAGISEAGAWRDEDIVLPDLGKLPLSTDPRYSPDDQKFYLVRGDHADGLGVNDGSVVCVVSSAALEAANRSIRAGDVVLIKRMDESGRVETSIRQVDETRDGLVLIAKPRRGEIKPIGIGDGVRISGLVLRATRVFGLAA